MTELESVRLLPDDFTKALRTRITQITDPLGGEVAIWKWVRDPANDSDVRDIAARYLLNSMRQQKRAITRAEEARVRLDTYRAELLAHVDTPEEIAQQKEWEARWKARQKAEAAELRAKHRALFKSVKDVNPSAIQSEMTKELYALIELGYPAELLVFGDQRVAKKCTFDRLPPSEWLNEWGFRSKRANAVADARRADDSTFGFFREVYAAMEEWQANLKAEWTADLLNQTFRIDGVSVTWGEATADQHQRRAESLRSHAEGTMQTASLHLAAVSDINLRGAQNLNGVTREAVAA